MELTPQLEKMASKVQKAKYLLWLHESTFVVTVQRKFHTEFGSEPPDISIYKSYKLCSHVVCIYIRKTPGKRPVNESKANEAEQLLFTMHGNQQEKLPVN